MIEESPGGSFVAEIGLANEQDVGREGEHVVVAHGPGGEVELAAPLSEELVRPSGAPEVKTPMIDAFHERGRRGRHAIRVDRPVPHRDRSRRRRGPLSFRAVGQQLGVA